MDRCAAVVVSAAAGPAAVTARGPCSCFWSPNAVIVALTVYAHTRTHFLQSKLLDFR